KIIVSEFVSLDGVIEAPEKWSIAYWSDEIAAFKREELFAAAALLLGRVTYEAFAPAWSARSGDEYTDRMNKLPKYVASRSLSDLSWNAQPLSNDIGGDIRRL